MKKARPYRRNLLVWVALLALLAATTGSAFVSMGAWNAVANLSIAALKVLLVALFFMHLGKTAALLRLVAVVALFMLAILFGLSATDYWTREIHPAPWEQSRQRDPFWRGPQ